MITVGVGAVLPMQHGPYRGLWKVIEVTERGALLEFVHDSEEFVGFAHLLIAPDGTPLTSMADQDFLGRAHFNAYSEVPW